MRALLFLALLVVPIHARGEPIPLWRAANRGMSLEEVKAAFPEAVVPAKPDHLSNNAGEERLRLGNVSIVDEMFAARFYFNSSGLIQVTLAQPEYQGLMASRDLFDKLTNVLRAKYGPELSKTVDSRISATFYNAESIWSSQKTTITLSLFAVNLRVVSFGVTYTAALAQEFENL